MVMRQSTADRARLAEILAFGGMPIDEIARHIGICERTVKKLRRCEAARQERARLREELIEYVMEIRIARLREMSPGPTEKRMLEDLYRMQTFLARLKCRR